MNELAHAHVNFSIRIRHHGDEQVKQNDDIDDAVRTEHEQAPKARVGFDAGQLEVLQPHHSEGGPEKRLRGLEYAVQENID